MLTTRIRPKISVNPLATTKYRPAAVMPFSITMMKSLGSSTAVPNPMFRPMKPIQRMHEEAGGDTEPEPTQGEWLARACADSTPRPLAAATFAADMHFSPHADVEGTGSCACRSTR